MCAAYIISRSQSRLSGIMARQISVEKVFILMPQQYKALQGFKDILPDEQPYWRLVEKVAVEVAETFGYQRIDTPTVEETSLYRRTSGEGTDVVEKEMYSFDDRPDKEGNSNNLTLRSEGTAGVVRAYLEHGMSHLSQPVKLYYLSVPVF